MNLAPGKYTFKVATSNKRGGIIAEEAAIRINIIPPFYMHFGFKLLSILFLISTGVLIYYWRTFQIRNRNLSLIHISEPTRPY